jgi:hypothetical protein
MEAGKPLSGLHGHSDARRNRAITVFLLMETLILFVAAPLAAMGVRTPVFIGGFLIVPAVFAIVTISAGIEARVLAILAVLLGSIGAAFRVHHPSVLTVWLGHFAVIAAILAVSVVIAKAVFGPGQVTSHRLAGAVSLYLNIGVMFASVYRLISELDPGAFVNASAQPTETAAVSAMLYFSYTTLTSTGFGEILPTNPLARSMANLEAISGQLYLAILLARLVTLHAGNRRDQ